MVFKKPYAFLIKNFRIIHIILTILTIYLAIATRTTISIFSEFISNGYTITIMDGLVSEYISPLIYVALILVIIIILAVYILLQAKGKSNREYFIAMLYYIIMLAFIIIAATLIGGLSNRLWDAAAARTYRDISLLIYFPQFIFVIMLAARALGFNVKKFDFKRDLKELEITDSDSAEVELNINFETYKAKRTFRRIIREIKYYIQENKLVLTIIGVVLVGVIAYLIFTNFEKTNYNYSENKAYSFNGFSMKITDSMLSDIDTKGNVIYDDKVFLVIRFDITNTALKDQKLDYNNIRLYYDNTYVTPSIDLGSKFIDYGNPYMGLSIASKATGTYIMAYQLPKSAINKNFKISIYNGSARDKDEFIAKTINIKLNPTKIMEVTTVRNASLGETISLSSSTIDNATVKLENPVITTRYEYTYTDCYYDDCKEYNAYVTSDNTYQNRLSLIVLDYELNLDATSASYKNINGISKFADSFMSINYTMNGNEQIGILSNVTPTNLKDKLVLQTTGNILYADSVNLVITIRNKAYTIKLK